MALQTIYALFADVADAERAIGALTDHGVTADHIGIAARRPAEQAEAARVRQSFTRVTDAPAGSLGEPEVAYTALTGTTAPATLGMTEKPANFVDTPANVDAVGKAGITTTTPQDAAAGAAVGSGVGLVTGLLAAAAALTIPGVGLVMAGGALAAALGAAAATTAAGAAVGGVTGYLRDMGMSEQAADSVHDRMSEGDYLLTIQVDPVRYDDIKQILLKYNAVGVDINAAAAGRVNALTPDEDMNITRRLEPTTGRTVDEALPPEVVVPDSAVAAENARVVSRETGDSIV